MQVGVGMDGFTLGRIAALDDLASGGAAVESGERIICEEDV